MPISTAYATSLTGGNVPWWAGIHTTANGYYFTPANSGGDYCNTAILNIYVANPNGAPTQHAVYSTVVLCPWSFTDPNRPDTWPAGSNRIYAGDSLETALPKCATLLHEEFHLMFGAGSEGTLEGSEEFCKLSPSLSLSPSLLYVCFICTCDIFCSGTGG